MWVTAAVALLSTASASARPKPPAQDLCRPFEAAQLSVHAEWGQPTATNGCFFFSGPYELGRDDHLGPRAVFTRAGDRITARLGSRITFSGVVRGDRVQLRRVSDHEFGSTWTVTEIIDARFVNSATGCTELRGTYRYTECDTARPQSCPGRCTIATPVTFTER
ncbi:MAG: hypothetical protein DRJ42_14660 [Deltaproteobacteria bacterium]|nr:MAG: hypothetical protein DRJ42_14660 [Deltaproteobacteria bacterium]